MRKTGIMLSLNWMRKINVEDQDLNIIITRL